MFLDNLFTACSLLQLALLSLEGLHATLFPIRHCLMLNWVHFKAVVCIWILAVRICRRGVIPDCTTSQSIRLGFAHNSCAFDRHCLLCDNCSEFEKKSPSYLSGAVSSERTLTVTMLVVIVLSTLAFLPFFGRCPWNKHKIARFIRSGPV